MFEFNEFDKIKCHLTLTIFIVEMIDKTIDTQYFELTMKLTES